MKTLFIIGYISIFLAACSYNTEKDKPSGDEQTAGGVPEITFENPSFDFGTLRHGEKVEYTFFFENTGTGELIIKEINAHCGCTVPEIEKHRYKAGEKGKIVVVFNTQGFRNNQIKITEVHTNAKDSIAILQLQAFIER